MPTHAEITVKLLGDASDFFKNLGEQNQDIKEQMDDNAYVFEKMAEVLGKDPQGKTEDQVNNVLAGKLLTDAATFFKALAEHNEPIKEQMVQNAEIYERISQLVTDDPMGVMD